jgi:hypothetical protein
MARSITRTLTVAAPSTELLHDGGPAGFFATCGEGVTITIEVAGFTSSEVKTLVGTLSGATPLLSIRLPGCYLTCTAVGLAGEGTVTLTVGRA